jgi:SAM-dependent methyltransferase
MSVLAALRKRLGLPDYSDSLEARMTARHEFSAKLVLDRVTGGSLLDIGASYGWLAHLLSGRYRVVGVEPSAESIEHARKNYPAGEFIQGSALELPFADASFDAVSMFEVLEHIPNDTELEAFREVRRVIRPGGYFFVSTPYQNVVSCATDPAWYFGHRHYTKERFCDMLTLSGFDIELFEVRGGVYEVSAMLLLYVFKHTLRAEAPFKRFIEAGRRSEFFGDKRGFCDIQCVARARA